MPVAIRHQLITYFFSVFSSIITAQTHTVTAHFEFETKFQNVFIAMWKWMFKLTTTTVKKIETEKSLSFFLFSDSSHLQIDFSIEIRLVIEYLMFIAYGCSSVPDWTSFCLGRCFFIICLVYFLCSTIQSIIGSFSHWIWWM